MQRGEGNCVCLDSLVVAKSFGFCLLTGLLQMFDECRGKDQGDHETSTKPGLVPHRVAQLELKVYDFCSKSNNVLGIYNCRLIHN